MATVKALSPTTCRRCDKPATHSVEDRFHKQVGVYCYDHSQEKAAQMTHYERLLFDTPPSEVS